MKAEFAPPAGMLGNKGMKILTINVTGIPRASSSNLIKANLFQDYDTVVVNPESLETLYGNAPELYHNRNERLLTSKGGSLLSSINIRRLGQVDGLLQMGGVVVCFMQPVRAFSYNWRHEGKDYSLEVNNYDWLLKSSDIKGVEYGKGETIDYIDPGHAFSDYLITKPSWSAYFDRDTCKTWEILASAYGIHSVALAKRVGLGHIVLLPSYYDYHNGELLERCIVKLLGEKETTPQPGWAKAISVPGQEKLISKITQVDEQVNDLEKERASLVNANDKLEHWKCLLYAKGKHELEPVARDALALLGCNVKPQADKEGDGTVMSEHGIALLEVGGSKGTIKIEKLGELTKNIGNYISKKGSNVKGILVGNPFCDEPLDNRPPKSSQKQLFAKELIESAEQQNIVILLSTDLYEVISHILKGGVLEPEKRSFQQKIFDGKGLVTLLRTE